MFERNTKHFENRPIKVDLLAQTLETVDSKLCSCLDSLLVSLRPWILCFLGSTFRILIIFLRWFLNSWIINFILQMFLQMLKSAWNSRQIFKVRFDSSDLQRTFEEFYVKRTEPVPAPQMMIPFHFELYTLVSLAPPAGWDINSVFYSNEVK